MAKEVIISIKGMQKYDDAPPDTIELVTEGKLTHSGGIYIISYQETELTGLDGALTTIQVEGDQVTMMRMGEFNAQMVFQEGRRHLSMYNTPYGAMTVGVNTYHLMVELDDKGGNIEIDYAIEVDNAMAGRNLFQININDYQGLRSLQLIMQDMQISARHAEASRREDARLREVLDGAPIRPDEGLVPTREEIANVFTVLRSDARLGNVSITERTLLERVNRGGAGEDPADKTIGRVKLRLILIILTEMGVCRVRGPEDGIYLFEINFNAPKTSIDSSPLMQSLRKQVEG